MHFFHKQSTCNFQITPPVLDDIENASLQRVGDFRINHVNFITASAGAVIESISFVVVAYTIGADSYIIVVSVLRVWYK